MSTEEIKHALIMPPGVIGDNVRSIVDYAVAAEEAGWDGFFPYDVLVWPPPPDKAEAPWVSEEGTWTAPEYQPFPDPWIALAGIATRTSKIKLGTWITPLPRRQPWQVARDIATLDRLSNGRVIFGAGLGKRADYEKVGIPFDPKTIGEKYDESLEIIGRLWAGERVSFKGKHYQIEDVAILPTPAQSPRPPIMIAGFWPNKKPFRRGAKWDGIMPVYGMESGNTKTSAELVKEMLGWYHSITDDPGDIFMPAAPDDGIDPPEGWVNLCREYGTTLLYSYPTKEWLEDMEGHIRQGPPR